MCEVGPIKKIGESGVQKQQEGAPTLLPQLPGLWPIMDRYNLLDNSNNQSSSQFGQEHCFGAQGTRY